MIEPAKFCIPVQAVAVAVGGVPVTVGVGVLLDPGKVTAQKPVVRPNCPPRSGPDATCPMLLPNPNCPPVLGVVFPPPSIVCHDRLNEPPTWA